MSTRRFRSGQTHLSCEQSSPPDDAMEECPPNPRTNRAFCRYIGVSTFPFPYALLSAAIYFTHPIKEVFEYVNQDCLTWLKLPEDTAGDVS